MDAILVFWLTVGIAVIICSILLARMQKKFKQLILIAIITLLIPVVYVSVDCFINSHSEACIWGESYMPLYAAFMLIYTTPIIFILLRFGVLIKQKICNYT
jgi:hypothetical protein